MTELSPVSHKSRLARVEETPPGSIGALVPNTEARLIDPESGADVAEGEEGEIWVRGPQVMRGYLNNDEATAETLVGDGWLRTGDVGRVDENGFFYIVDRLKELIKYKGHQVPPAELEAVLVSHPKVKDAGVIGMPMEDGGETPKAFVVAEDGVGGEELMAYVSERVAPYKKVREVEFVDEIPKSASGKILRRLLREEHARPDRAKGSIRLSPATVDTSHVHRHEIRVVLLVGVLACLSAPAGASAGDPRSAADPRPRRARDHLDSKRRPDLHGGPDGSA